MEKRKKNAPAFLRTGCHHGPYAFEPALAFFTARSLRHFAIDHDEANRLFRQVIGRLDAGSGDEAQVTFAMFTEAIGQILRFFAARDAIDDLGPKFVAGVLQFDLEACFAEFFAAMDNAKQAS